MEFHQKEIRETLFVNLLSNSLNAQILRPLIYINDVLG